MDWPWKAATGLHLDKRFMDDYQHLGWGYLVERYGEASVLWLAAAVWFSHLKKGGDE